MSKFGPKSFNMSSENQVYVVVERNELCTHVTKGIIATKSYETAKMHLRPGREILGPIPLVDNNSEIPEPFAPIDPLPKNPQFKMPNMKPRFDPVHPKIPNFNNFKPKFNPDNIDL